MRNAASDPKADGSATHRKDVVQAFVILATIGVALCALSAVSLIRFGRGGPRQELAAPMTVRELQTLFRNSSKSGNRTVYVCLSGKLRAQRPLTVKTDQGTTPAILVRESIVEEVQLEHVAAVAGAERVLSQMTTVAEQTRRAPCVLDDGTGELPVHLRANLPLPLPVVSETPVPPQPNELIHYGALEYKAPAELTTWQGNVKRSVVAYSLHRRILPDNVQVRIEGTVRPGATGPVLASTTTPSRPFKLVVLRGDRPPAPAGLPGSAQAFMGLLAGLAGLACLGWSVWILRHPPPSQGAHGP